MFMHHGRSLCPSFVTLSRINICVRISSEAFTYLFKPKIHSLSQTCVHVCVRVCVRAHTKEQTAVTYFSIHPKNCAQNFEVNIQN
jgi:hypothetical protein